MEQQRQKALEEVKLKERQEREDRMRFSPAMPPLISDDNDEDAHQLHDDFTTARFPDRDLGFD